MRFLIILTARLFNRLGIDAGELNGDGGVRRLFTKANLTHTGAQPGSAAGLPGLHGRESAS